MRSSSSVLFAVALTALCAIGGVAGTGPDGPPPGPPPGMPPGPPPIVATLDANSDRKIDATEIANAPTALLKLDKDADGALSRDELVPPPPSGAPADAPKAPDGSTLPPPPPPADGACPPTGDKPAGPPPGGPEMGGMPVMNVLDANNDGALSADEIKNAPAALLKLDANSDGVLTPDEFDRPVKTDATSQSARSRRSRRN